MKTPRQKRQAKLVTQINARWSDENILHYWNNPPRTLKGRVTAQALKITDALTEVAKLRGLSLPCT